MAVIDLLEARGWTFDLVGTFSASKKEPTPKLLLAHHFMYSEKDIVYNFSDYNNTSIEAFPTVPDLLVNACKRQRCLRTHIETKNSKFTNIQRQIKTGWALTSPDGVLYQVYISFVDICGLGQGGLDTQYSIYVGKMLHKGNLSQADKENLLASEKFGTIEYDQYALGDLCMTDIVDGAVKLENDVRKALSLPEIDASEKKLTVGAMVARILRDFLKGKLDIDVDDLQLNKYSVFASSKSQQDYLQQFKRGAEVEKLVYLGMVDGGRCVRELAKHSTMSGDLDDIDIDGCYGNGLKNQDYAIGNPTIDPKTYTLGEFLKKYEKQLVPGLWNARLFGSLQEGDKKHQQDLLLSKIKDGGTRYLKRLESIAEDYTPDNLRELEDALEASMTMLTNEVYAANLNHDTLEIIKNYTSNDEKSNWLNNIKVTGFAGYLKKDEVSDFPLMEEGFIDQESLRNSRSATIYSTKWFRVPLKEYATALLTERKKFDKKTPMNEFIKLVINATYGVIASQYFDTDDTGISNTVVANNITARARTLGWVMAKSLRCAMIITDGGVFDTQNVLHLTGINKKPTINGLFKITFDDYKNSDRHPVYELKPLCPELPRLSELKDAESIKLWLTTIDKQAWEHCASLFPELSIFKDTQFKFESKHPYTELVLRNKSDYILTNKLFTYNGNTHPVSVKFEPYRQHKQRGTKGVGAFKTSVALYDAIASGKATLVSFVQNTLIGLSEYNMTMGRIGKVTKDTSGFGHADTLSFEAQSLFDKQITAGDVRTQQKTLYSHNPTSIKHPDYQAYEEAIQVTEVMKGNVHKQIAPNPELGRLHMKSKGWN